MPDLPAGTVTFLFTDIEGSTRLLHELGDRYAEVLTQHRRALREAFRVHGGAEVDTQGDAFFYAFARASDALAAAEAGQAALEGGPVRVRMGVHTGEPTVTEEGYVGADVHLAARVMGAGHGGQVLVSEATAQQIEGALRGLGAHKLKDIEERVQLFQLGDRRFPPLKTLNNSNLPLPQTPLLGRKKELVDVLRLLRVERARLVTVTGPGGIGKTRFALEATHELIEEFAHGVWFVDLSALRDPALVVPTIASTFGAKGELAEHVADRQLLLFLDNFEQVVDAARDVADLLRGCPNVELLITSREPLHVAGEREYPLGPLAEAPAVELFRERATAVDPDFDASWETLAAIIDGLDRLPLAIELAAARVKALGADELLARLAERLPLLSSRARDLPERQRTLRATIQWSYDLLGETEQQLFARLSVLAGGCTLEAAEAVCGADLDRLESLVDRSLVRFDKGRYSMLETIRELAAELLDATPAAETTRGDLIDWAMSVADTSGLTAAETYRPERIDRIRAEYLNIRTALEACRRAERWSDLGAICSHLGSFWTFVDHLADGQSWLSEALAAPGLSTELRLRLTARSATLAMQHGDYDAGVALHEAALALARSAGDEVAAATAIRNLAVLASERGDLAKAAALHQESVSVARRLGDPLYLSPALGDMGLFALAERDFERARDLALEAAALAHEAGVPVWIAIGLANAAESSLELGDVAAATELLTKAVRTAAEEGAWTTLPAALSTAAALAVGAGRPELAARLIGACDALCERQAYALTGSEAQRRKATEELVVEALGRARTDALAAEGRQLSPEEASELALSLDSP